MNYQYSQDADPRWKASGPGQSVNTVAAATDLQKGRIPLLKTVSSAGACLGIASWWQIKRALNQDFWDWFGPPTSAAPTSTRQHAAAGEPVLVIKQMMHEQINYLKTPGASRAGILSAAINRILSQTKGHLVNKRGMVLRSNMSWKSLAYEIGVAKGYVSIGITHGDNWGHALAAHVCSDGSVELFDPNFGEYDFDSLSTFFNWMATHMSPSYGFDRLTTFELQTLARPGH